MTTRIILALFICLAIARSAVAADTYTIHEQVKAGQKITYVITQKATDHSDGTNNGIPSVSDSTTDQYWKVTETELAAADGSATQVRLEVDSESFDVRRQDNQPEKKTPCPYIGHTVILTLHPDGTATDDFPGNADGDDIELLHGIISPDAINYPDKPVTVGDTWDNTAKAFKGGGFGPKDHISSQCKLDGVKTINGKQMAQLFFTTSAQYHIDGNPNGPTAQDTVSESKGALLVDLNAGLVTQCDSRQSDKTTSAPTATDKFTSGSEAHYHSEVVDDTTVWPPKWTPDTKPTANAPPASPAAPQPPPMVNVLPDQRVALRILSPQGNPLPIDQVDSIEVTMPNGVYTVAPTVPNTPLVLGRMPDGSVLLDAQMFAASRRLSNFRAGQPMVIAFRSNHSPMRVAGGFPAANSRAITLTAVGDPQEISFDPAHGPDAATPDDIAGRVIDENGQPVAGAVASYPKPKSFGYLTGVDPATTDTDGIFRFPRGQQHEWYMQIEKSGYAPRWIIDPPTGKGFTVVLDSRTRLRGTLKLSDGSAAANATIELFLKKITSYTDGFNDPIPWTAQCDGQGAYDLPLEPGVYDVQVTSSTGLVERIQQIKLPSRQSVELPSQLNAGVHLKLQALDSLTGQPVAGVKFCQWELAPGYNFPRPGTERTTDAKGFAEWDHLFPGPMRMHVESADYARWWLTSAGTPHFPQKAKNNSMNELIRVAVQLQNLLTAPIRPLPLNLAGPAQTVQISVEKVIHVSGQVVNPQGLPVRLARVNVDGLWPTIPMTPPIGGTEFKAITDQTGKFSLSFPDLRGDSSPMPGEPGGYAIVASDMMNVWGKGTTDRFTAKPGESKSVVVKLTDRPAGQAAPALP